MVILKNIRVYASKDNHFVAISSSTVESSTIRLNLFSLHIAKLVNVDFCEPICEIVMNETFFNLGLPPKI